MEFEPKEQEIIKLLTKLKNSSGNYPSNLLASRRQTFLGQIASVGAGIGAGATLKATAKASKAGASAHLSAAVESILVVAIVVQTGVIAYNYRTNIADFFHSISSVPTTVSIPATESFGPEVVASDVPATTENLVTTGTPTITEDPIITVVTAASETESGVAVQEGPAVATATPDPNNNNGNHYGQTPKPPKPTQEQKIDIKPTKQNVERDNDKKK